MQLRPLLSDNRAVSPVVGVILMVAITVVLAAVVGTFALGMADQMLRSTPTASVSFSIENETQRISITHSAGKTLGASNVEIKSTQQFSYAADTTANVTSADWEAIGGGGDVSAGDTVTIEANEWDASANDGDFAGETIRVIYRNPDAASSSTLAKYEVPN